MIDSKIRIILHIFTGAVLIVSAACGALFLSKTTFSWKVGFGYSIYDESQNTGYFINVSVLLWVCVSILFAIFELLMICKVKPIVSALYHGYIRPILFIAMGIVHFGISNNFGIIVGILAIVVGIVWAILNSFEYCDVYKM